jgi:hypothetical protein
VKKHYRYEHEPTWGRRGDVTEILKIVSICHLIAKGERYGVVQLSTLKKKY